MWYNRLVGKGPEVLLTSAVDLHNDLFIGQQYMMKDMDEPKYRYACFSSHIEFQRYMEKQPLIKRTFNEVVPGDRARKLAFDIDISGMRDEETAMIIVNSLLKATIKVFSKLEITLRPKKDIFLFESNRENKTSYHIIISNYCFANCRVTEYLFEKIIKKVPADEAEFVDNGIYSRNHMLRIMGNHKVDSKKNKTFVPEFVFDGRPIENKTDSDDLFEHSLLTWTFNCKKIPIILPVEITPEIEVNDRDVRRALTLFKKSDLSELYEPDMERSENNGIYLKRIMEGFCKICRRSHTSNNAFIWINKESVFFKCFCTKKQNIKLGSLKKTTDDDSSDDESSVEKDETPEATVEPTRIEIVEYLQQVKTGEEKTKSPERLPEKIPLYLYKLEDEKFFVERHPDRMKRLEEIKKRKGPHFIRKYPYIESIEKMEFATDRDEEELIIKLMKQYGIENVRGGIYDRIILDQKDREYLEHLIKLKSG